MLVARPLIKLMLCRHNFDNLIGSRAMNNRHTPLTTSYYAAQSNVLLAINATEYLYNIITGAISNVFSKSNKMFIATLIIV